MSFLPLDVLLLLTRCLIPSAFEPQLNQIERRVWVDEFPFVQISCHSFSDKESPISANSIKNHEKCSFHAHCFSIVATLNKYLVQIDCTNKIPLVTFISKKTLCLNSRPFWGQITSHPIPGLRQAPVWSRYLTDPVGCKKWCLGKS